jgi:kynurenine formamidase
VSIESTGGLTVLDLTRRLEAGMAIYSDDGYSDPPFERREWCTVATRGFQVSELRLGTQTGTHVDAPAHFVASGATLDQLPVDRLLGRYFLADLPARASDSIARLCEGFAGEPILFLRCPEDSAARMSPDRLERLLALPPRVWVLDGAVDIEGRPPLEFHRLIAAAGVYLVEDLEREAARAVQPGGEVLALPLALMSTSGSPCRVVVRQRSE